MGELKRFSKSAVKNLPNKDKSGIGAEVKEMVLDYCRSRPRNMQVSLGPSSVGDPCDRSLVARLSNLPSSDVDGNPWYSFMGTAIHAEMALVLEHWNKKLEAEGKPADWLIEHKLAIQPPIVPYGHGDAYKISKGQVIDWKLLGKGTSDEISANGPSEIYRVQTHVYGLGYFLLGLEVKEVAVVALPRNPSAVLPFLHEMVVWSEPWDQQLALNALTRVEKLFDVTRKLNAAEQPRRLLTVHATPHKGCMYCPIQSICPDAKTS